jgi:hypothetical protein
MRTDMDALPTVDQYKAALQQLSPQMHPKHRELLLEHYRAPGHCITASELATKVGYKSYSGVNVQYGTLGRSLNTAMNWTLPPHAQASFSIAWFLKPQVAGDEWIWEMHEELATALEELHWVDDRQD